MHMRQCITHSVSTDWMPGWCCPQCAELEFGGKKVAVPQGRPVPNPQFAHSSFWQDEYLLYDESQLQMRYLITFKMAGGY